MAAAGVRLRPVTLEDMAVLERLDSPEVAGPFNWFGHRPAGRHHERLLEDGYLSRERGRLLVVAGDGEVAGDVSWHAVDHGPPPASRCWDIGITLLPEWRGKGLGSAAQRLLADYLFATTTAERVQASTDVGNLAEQRALERAGFAREGVLRRAQFRGGAWHDLVLYARVRGD
jgi:RimJ/RimL family protein N-acetyltransferase